MMLPVVRDAAQSYRLNVVEACASVLSFLRRQGEHADSVRPDLPFSISIFATREHCDMLREVKEDPEFRRIPVVVMAADDSYGTIFQAYNLHANAYILKPKEQDEFLRVVKATLSFWLKLAQLPKE